MMQTFFTSIIVVGVMMMMMMMQAPIGVGAWAASGEWHTTSLLNAALGGQFSRSAYAPQPNCLPIPANMTLCKDIGYQTMRLPNLLDHETLDEATEQSGSWLRLSELKCHADTQLFLCSLFAPVCLDRLIYPCRSLCEAVKAGCEPPMQAYGYAWPDMVRCDQYPLDNDMCIRLRSSEKTDSAACRACSQAKNTESIIDNSCRADFVLRVKVKKFKNGILRGQRATVLKIRDGINRRDLRRPIFKNVHISECCENLHNLIQQRNPPLLIMGTKNSDGHLVPTFIMRWKSTNTFKKAVTLMDTWDCANPQRKSRQSLPRNRGTGGTNKETTAAPLPVISVIDDDDTYKPIGGGVAMPEVFFPPIATTDLPTELTTAMRRKRKNGRRRQKMTTTTTTQSSVNSTD